jgi:hypothetical protein
MTKLSRPIISTLIVLQAVMSLFAAVYAQAADKTSEPKVKVDDRSFKCITDMTVATATVASTFPSRLST